MNTNISARLASRASSRLFEVRADASRAGDIEIYLYDVIDAQWGVGARQFVDAIAGATGSISLHINSPGGDVFEARTMVSALQAARARGVNVTTYIDGLAASAASYVALASDEVVMSEGALMMIHCAWAMTVGNSDDMLSMADLLDKIDQTIAADYSKKTGKAVEEMLQLMEAETWLDADEATELGFCDRIAAAPAAATKNQWDLSAYKRAPVLAQDTPATPAPDPEVIEPTTESVAYAHARRMLDYFERIG
jgi:ATP-dependent Clp protease protease subunit